MKRNKHLLLLTVIILDATSAVLAAPSAGTFNGAFDRLFVAHLHRMMSQEELFQVIGSPGREIRPQHFHWDGDNKSYLNVDIIDGHMRKASVLTPKGEFIVLQ